MGGGLGGSESRRRTSLGWSYDILLHLSHIPDYQASDAQITNQSITGAQWCQFAITTARMYNSQSRYSHKTHLQPSFDHCLVLHAFSLPIRLLSTRQRPADMPAMAELREQQSDFQQVSPLKQHREASVASPRHANGFNDAVRLV